MFSSGESAASINSMGGEPQRDLSLKSFMNTSIGESFDDIKKIGGATALNSGRRVKLLFGIERLYMTERTQEFSAPP